jgi:hypothetical protein
MRPVWLWTVWCLSLLGLLHSNHRLLLTPLPALPAQHNTFKFRQWVSFSTAYPSLFADFFWMHIGIYTGGHEHLYEKTAAIDEEINAINLLDPYFKEPYVYAGPVLPAYQKPIQNVQKILQKGMQKLPHAWDIAFLYGFNSFYYEKNFTQAAWALQQAAQQKNAPPSVALLATRLAIEAGVPQEAIALSRAFEKNTSDPAQKKIWSERTQHLQHAQNMIFLNNAVQTYQKIHHTPPHTLGDLVQKGLITHIPEEPFGDVYRINPEGLVVSNTPTLQLHQNP